MSRAGERLLGIVDETLTGLMMNLEADLECNLDTAGRIYAAAIKAARRVISEEYPDRCEECGDNWPCSTSSRRDVSGLERARHYIRGAYIPKAPR